MDRSTRSVTFTSPSVSAISRTENAPTSFLASAQSWMSAFWYLFPVGIILAVGVCQGICVRFSTWSDRRRMRAFTQRSCCLQDTRSRLCRRCDVRAVASTGQSAGSAGPDRGLSAPAPPIAPTAAESVTPLAATIQLHEFAAPALGSSAKAVSAHSRSGSSTAPAGHSLTSPLRRARPSALRLSSSAHDAAVIADAAGKSPLESPVSLTSEAPSLTTSSFDEILTPQCVPTYSINQRRSMEEQRRATVDDWLQAKRAMGEISKAEL